MTEKTFLYPEAIVSSDWLAGHLDDPEVRIFECTMDFTIRNIYIKLST